MGCINCFLQNPVYLFASTWATCYIKRFSDPTFLDALFVTALCWHFFLFQDSKHCMKKFRQRLEYKFGTIQLL